MYFHVFISVYFSLKFKFLFSLKLWTFCYLFYIIVKPSYKGKEVHMTNADLIWKLIQELLNKQSDNKDSKDSKD